MIFNIAGGVPAATQATPTISVDSAGLITASATQTAGYVVAGTKSATKQLTVQAAKTVTPSASAQTAVAASRFTTGAVTVAAIPTTYKRMATGTVTATSSGSSPSTTFKIAVTGLGFTPSHVIVALKTAPTSGTRYICSAYDTAAFCANDEENPVTVTKSYSSGAFTLSIIAAAALVKPTFSGTYYYVAWA